MSTSSHSSRSSSPVSPSPSPSTTRRRPFSARDDHIPAPLRPANPANNPYYRDLYPGRERSLSGISLRAFLLGTVFALGTSWSIYLIAQGQPYWRATTFISLLALFHFLEFWVTALSNTPQATVSAFLLASNGAAYQIAHGTALVETLIFSAWQPAWHPLRSSGTTAVLSVTIGVALVVLGQTVRTAGMLTAGTNFNHHVQSRRAAGHELVSTGVYAHCRHPAYFGFFWWALGSQLVCGNAFSVLAYAFVLWRFFDARIKGEERFLGTFFGNEYARYKLRTWVGIPFIK